MYFGELKEYSQDYRNGHSTGGVRALGYARSKFAYMSDEKMYSAHDIYNLLSDVQNEWLKYCDTVGMGVEDEG